MRVFGELITISLLNRKNPMRKLRDGSPKTYKSSDLCLRLIFKYIYIYIYTRTCPVFIRHTLDYLIKKNGQKKC